MKNMARLVIIMIAALGVMTLLPAVSSATSSLGPRSPCSSSGNFAVTIGYDQTTQKPTVDHSSNSTCVMGGDTVSFTTNLPSGWSWSATFPSQSLGSSVFTNSCTFGSASGQNSSCTVVSEPGSGDYNYTIMVTDTSGGNHTLDPKVIIKGLGKPKPRKTQKKSDNPPAAAPAPQQ
jgi:hypothetical protein